MLGENIVNYINGGMTMKRFKMFLFAFVAIFLYSGAFMLRIKL